MADTPTIVVAHLDDEKLKASIQSLVTNINNAMDSIKTKTTSTVAEMQKSLQTLGNIKVGSSGTDDGGASRRKKAQEEETKAVKDTIATRKELKTTLDQQASAMQPKSARDSYYAFFQGYKAQAQQLGQQIQEFETALNKATSKRVGEIEKQINATKSRIQELNNEMNRSYATNNMGVAAQKQRELQNEVRKLTELQQKLNNVGNEFATSKIALAAMYAEHHRISNIMKEEVATQRQQKQESQQQVQAAQQVASATQANAHAERDAAQAAREHADRIKDMADKARNVMSVYGTSAWQYEGRINGYVYAENDARAKGLTIEQQIANLMQQEVETFNRSNQAARERLDTETKISQEYDKRKSYKTPYTGINESFNRMVANRIGLTPADIKSSGTSISSTTTYVKQLEQAYKELSRTEKNSPFGKQLREQIQLTSREMQRLQAEMSRPINLASAMSLPTRTIEEMTYKMRQLASYRSGLDVDKQKNEINQVNAEYTKLQKKMDEVMQKNQQMIGSNNALGRSWNYMKNRLAFYFTVGASTQFVKNLIEIRSQYEMNERALGILINSAERGTQIFNELSQMALVSPYTLIELSTAAKQLTAYDVAAKDVVDTTRRLADMASAVGIPIERLTYALGQIKAYGYLNSRDARMFANAGIPLVKQLSEYYTELEGRLVSTADIYDKIKKKAIGYNDVMQVITKMTDEGGKFFDFQAKMADTLKVRLANFTLAWNNMLNDIGKSNQGMLVGGINLLTRMLKHWRDLENAMYAIVLAYGAVKAGQILYVAWNQKVSLSTAAADVSSKKLVGALYSMKGAFTSLVTSPMTWWMLLATAATSAAISLYQANEKLKEFNKSIRDGAKENYKNISDFFKQYSDLRESLYKYDEGGRNIIGTKNIDKEQAEKVWEAIREQIELTSATSDEYIKRLLLIENESDRVREGFDVLENIQAVNAALKELGDKEIDLNQDKSGLWNLWTLPDGLIGNIKDYTLAVDNAKKETDSFLNKAAKTYLNYWLSQRPIIKSLYKELFPEQFGDTEKALQRLQDDLKDTTDSINKFINESGWGNAPEKIAETYNQIAQKIANENSLAQNEAFTLQLGIEEAKSQAMMQALKTRINDENAALSVARDENSKKDIQARIDSLNEQLNIFSTTTAASRVYWNDFTKYMKEQHISEVRQMFRGMDDEQIKSINFQDGEYKKFVNRMVQGYADKHKMSYDEAFNYLRSWVRDANQWSIFIKLNIGTGEDKSIYDILNEADSAADAAYKKMQRLQRRQKELQGKTDENSRKESAKITKELTDLQEEYNDALEKGGHSQKEEKQAANGANKSRREAAKAQREAETELQKALKDELQLIDKVRSQYDKLSKAGYDNTTALNMVTSQFESSISHINSILGKNGLPLFDISKFAGTDNPNAILAMLKSQLDAAKGAKNIKPSEIKDLEVKFSEITVDAKVYNMKKISEGLNNELGKLKEEYELAVEMDATPELGNVFADMMGLDQSELRALPRTFSQVVRQLQASIDKTFADKGITSDFNLVTMLDKGDFENWVAAQGKKLDSEFVKSLNSIREYANKVRLDEAKETTKNWAELVGKYGDLQNKIMGIYKETINEQLSIIRQFGDDVQKEQAINLASQIKITGDPQEIARLQAELAKVLSQVTSGNKTAANVAGATFKMQENKIAAATWNDFKDSDLYTMTFEDMSNNSTHAIQLIIDKLETLKNQVKEDPASMKALMQSMKQAESELESRNPYLAITSAIREMRDASAEAKVAQQELADANKEVEEAQRGVDEAEDAGPAAQAKARERLTRAIQRQNAAEMRVVQTENKAQKSYKKLQSGLQGLSGQLQNVQELFTSVAKLFADAGDDETADAINAISEGFSVMTTVIMTVVVAMEVLNSTCPYLLAIAAALSVIIGLVSFLSGNNNKKITEQVEESEKAVKRLEIAYVDLQHAIDNAYGTSVVGAKQAALANKELQLAEIQRQILLEKSREAKDRDDDKILDLQKEYKELMYEIKDGYVEIVNDLMGTDVASFAEDLVSSMIDAFREGEDYMKIFSDKFDEMIDSMIMKMIVSRVLTTYLDNLWKTIDERINARSEKEADAYAKAQEANNTIKSLSDDEVLERMGFNDYQIITMRTHNNARYKKLVEDYRKAAEAEERSTKQALDTVSTINDSDISYVMEEIAKTSPAIGERLKELISQYYKFGEKASEDGSNLSGLQQGIQGITEDTANALEAYMNGVSQQVYLHSNLLMQIRDAVVGFDLDVQTATVSQILLQLQSSYQVQMSIQSILSGWSNPSGMAMRVEMI